MIKRLEHYNCNINVSDSHVIPKEAIKEYDIKLKKLIDLKDQDAIIIAVSHEEYTNISLNHWSQMLKPNGVIIDVKSVYKKNYFFKIEI